MRRLVLAAAVVAVGCRGEETPANVSPAAPPAVVERTTVDLAEQRYRDCVSKLYPLGSGWSVAGVACSPGFAAEDCQATITRGEALVMVSGQAGPDWAAVREARLVSPVYVNTGTKTP